MMSLLIFFKSSLSYWPWSVKIPQKVRFFFRKMWPSSSRWTQSLCQIVKIVARGRRPWSQLASKPPHNKFTTSCFVIKKGNFIEVLQPSRVYQGYSRCYKFIFQIFWLIWNSFQIFRSPRLANSKTKWLILIFPSLPYLASNMP